MNEITKKYLKGEKIFISKAKTTIELLPVGKLDNQKDVNSDPYVKIWGVEQRISEFFESLEKKVRYHIVEFVGYTDNSIIIRRTTDFTPYTEDTYIFDDKSINNPVIYDKFTNFIALCKIINPTYQEDRVLEDFARNLTNVTYNNRCMDMDELKSIPGYYDFYLKNKDIVEKVVRKRFKEKYPEVLDVSIRILVLGFINYAFFMGKELPVLLSVDILLAAIICMGDIKLQKFIASIKVKNKVKKGIEGLENNKMGLLENSADVTTKGKILRAIKVDINTIYRLKYDGYETDINSLYVLTDRLLKVKSNNVEGLENMKDILYHLIDIERSMCTKFLYFDELNAEKLLKEVSNVEEEIIMVDGPGNSKSLSY